MQAHRVALIKNILWSVLFMPHVFIAAINALFVILRLYLNFTDFFPARCDGVTGSVRLLPGGISARHMRRQYRKILR